MIIGEVCVNPRDVLNAWYRFEPGACAYCFTIKIGDDEENTEHEQWTTKKEDVEKYMKLVEKCIKENNAHQDDMAELAVEMGGAINNGRQEVRPRKAAL